MRTAVVANADRHLCRDVARDVLHREGAHLVEGTHTHTRFRDWNAGGELGFARDGYVGFHGHAGEADADLRVVVRATFPRRALVAASAAALAAALVLYALQPRPGAWIAVAVLLWPVWTAALVVDLTSRHGSREAEGRLTDALVEELRARGQTVLTEGEVRRQEFERELEGEVAERRLKGARGAKR